MISLVKNPSFRNIPIFDLWWIDLNGDLQIIIKTTELYVYLCKPDRYPKQVNGITITPHPPSHLPPQHTVILKWVHHCILNVDLEEELKSKYDSLFSIKEMAGTETGRTRHLKVEFLDKKDYDNILNSGKICLFGHLITVDVFLSAPKILICNRCNTPGHTKNSCKNSTVDICRRCGENRTNLAAHKDCQVKSHHCGGPHESTDYKCKFIADYRRQLIVELKKHPERLPP
ncbi:unnamed protein product [Didymodactylos carnosus]|uniref:CCHC-type domain-containing protein n=1 Tax=Didymodactylos carnosus TaxID=1234261 RepID=A0A8S2YN62_9BILA|nr:unnamed protein product [Didymodactylos carnosus]